MADQDQSLGILHQAVGQTDGHTTDGGRVGFAARCQQRQPAMNADIEGQRFVSFQRHRAEFPQDALQVQSGANRLFAVVFTGGSTAP